MDRAIKMVRRLAVPSESDASRSGFYVNHGHQSFLISGPRNAARQASFVCSYAARPSPSWYVPTIGAHPNGQPQVLGSIPQ